MRKRVKEIFEEVFENISMKYILPSEEDTIDFIGLKKVLENALEADFCGKEYVAYLSATNPYKHIEDIKGVRDELLLKAREVLLKELKDPDRVDKNILEGFRS